MQFEESETDIAIPENVNYIKIIYSVKNLSSFTFIVCFQLAGSGFHTVTL